MDARVQRRVQRYGWDLAASDYEAGWQQQLADAQALMLEMAALRTGERVLDVACGTGLVSLAAAQCVGPGGEVLGVDLSGQMVERAQQRAVENTRYARMDAEALALPERSFDVALCALGLMYLPQPEAALAEMRRVLRPGGRVALAVWGERARCAWSALFPIVDAEVSSEVCPLFFRLGLQGQLARSCAEAGFVAMEERRISTTLRYADDDAACAAAFIAGPVALAWSRFNDTVRARVRERYLDAIAPWRHGAGYELPGEFVLASARRD